jgi:hypothetical protein
MTTIKANTMKNLITNEYLVMLESDKKAKRILDVIVIIAILLIICELYVLLKK